MEAVGGRLDARAGAAGAPTRWVDLAGVDNVRDLGGLPVRGGGSTRFGVVFRASTLQQATAADAEVLLGRLRLRTVIDLRGPAESELEGHGPLAAAAVHRVNLPVGTRRPAAADAVPAVQGLDLAARYHEMLDGSGASLVAAARIIADTSRHTVVFHCAAGKDRTGVLAAVLLDAVGVTAEAVVEDYALTAQRLDRLRSRLTGLPSYRDLPPVAQGIMTADPSVMARFLDTLQARFGGGAQWLRSQGLGRPDLDRLREVLVGPDGTGDRDG